MTERSEPKRANRARLEAIVLRKALYIAGGWAGSLMLAMTMPCTVIGTFALLLWICINVELFTEWLSS